MAWCTPFRICFHGVKPFLDGRQQRQLHQPFNASATCIHAQKHGTMITRGLCRIERATGIGVQPVQLCHETGSILQHLDLLMRAQLRRQMIRRMALHRG